MAGYTVEESLSKSFSCRSWFATRGQVWARKLASCRDHNFGVDAGRPEIDMNGQRLKQWHGLDPNGVRIELVQGALS